MSELLYFKASGLAWISCLSEGCQLPGPLFFFKLETESWKMNPNYFGRIEFNEHAFELLKLAHQGVTLEQWAMAVQGMSTGAAEYPVCQKILDEGKEYRKTKSEQCRLAGLKSAETRLNKATGVDVRSTGVNGPQPSISSSSNNNNRKRSKSKEPFVIPTLEQVTDYVNEISSSINPQAFLDHYEANGWMVGKVRMKSWKATIRKWNTNQKENPNATSKPQQFLTANEKRDNAAASTFDFLSRPGGMLDGVDFSELLSGGQGDGPQHRSGQKEVQPRNDPGSTALERNSSQ